MKSIKTFLKAVFGAVISAVFCFGAVGVQSPNFIHNDNDKKMNQYVLSDADNSESGEGTSYSAGLAYYVDATEAGNLKAIVGAGTCTDSTVKIPTSYTANSISYKIVGIRYGGFAQSSLNYISFTTVANISEIGSEAFAGSGLKRITIPDNVTELNPATFSECGDLSTVLFSTEKKLTKIDDYCFAGDYSLSNCALPEGLTTIGEAAFQGCSSLIRAVFPSTATTVGAYAFAECTSIGIIYFPASVTHCAAYAFKGVTYNKAFAVFAGSIPGTFTDQWNYVDTNGSATKEYLVPDTNRGVSSSDDNNEFYYSPDPDAASGEDDVIIWLYVGQSASIGANKGHAVTVPTVLKEGELIHHVTAIDKQAFYNHVEIPSITISATTSLTKVDSSTGASTTTNYASVLKKIGAQAFAGCTYLTSVSFPLVQNGGVLATIDANAFDGDSRITALTIPSSVETIGDYAFRNTNAVASLVFEGASDNTSHLVSVGTSAFQFCGSNFASVVVDTTLTLPVLLTTDSSKTTTYGDFCFSDSKFFSTLIFAEANTEAKVVVNQYAFNKANHLAILKLSSHVISLGKACFQASGAKSGDNKVGLAGADQPYPFPFLQSVYIPSSCSTIANDILWDNARASVYTDAASKPSGWDANFARTNDAGTTLGSADTATVGAGNWVSVFQLDTSYTYGVAAPGKTSSSLHLMQQRVSGNNGSSDGSHGLFDFVQTSAVGATPRTCALTRYYYLKNSVAKTADYLQDVYVPQTVTMADGNAYTVTAIASYAFMRSYTSSKSDGIRSVRFPNTITKIGDIAFGGCAIMSSISSADIAADGAATNETAGALPSALTTLGDCVFCYTGITSVVLLGTLSAIGIGVFMGCMSLASLTMNGESSIFQVANNVLYGIGGTYNHHVITSKGGGTYTDDTVTIPDGNTTIDGWAFRGVRVIKNLSIPWSVSEIKLQALNPISYANSYEQITFYQGNSNAPKLTTIEASMFWGETALKTFQFPTSLTTLKDKAFYNCTALKDCPTTASGSLVTNGALDLSACTSLNAIGSLCFYLDTALTSLKTPTSLTDFGNNATSVFQSCSGLLSADLSSMKKINSNSFLSCTSLKTVTFGAQALTLSQNAFSGCTSLNNPGMNLDYPVTLNGGSKVGVFQGCTGMIACYIPTGSTLAGHPVYGCSNSALRIYFNDTYAQYTAGASRYPSGWNKKGTTTAGADNITSFAFRYDETTGSTANTGTGTGVYYWKASDAADANGTRPLYHLVNGSLTAA
jgi:hypothetical protein